MLDSRPALATTMTSSTLINQGDLYWLEPQEVSDLGSAQRHPYVVVQDDVFNHSRITTTVVCALTTNLHRATEPGNIPLEPGEGSLPKPSVIVVSQVLSVHKAQLGLKIGELSASRVQQVLDGLRFQQRSFFAP